MLSHADAELVRRDAALPGLGLLLDPESFLATLQTALPTVQVTHARSTYLRYKPEMNCLVAYQLEVEGQRLAVHGKAVRADDQGKLFKWSQRSAGAGFLESGLLFLEEASTIIAAVPVDAKVKGLKSLAQLNADSSFLSTLFPENPELWQGQVHCLRYKPERRFVAQLSVQETPKAVLKAYTQAGYDSAYRNATPFQSGQVLRIAKRLGRSRRHQTIGFEWLSGQLLKEAIATPEFNLSTLESVGMALAEFHAQPAESLVMQTRAAEAAKLFAIAQWLSFIYPPLAQQAQALARLLAQSLQERPTVCCPIHGDFSADQVLLMTDGVAILDLDRAVRGHPAADFGQFLACLDYQVLKGELPQDLLPQVRAALLAGYSRTGVHSLGNRLDRTLDWTLDLNLDWTLDLSIAIALFGLTPEPFRYLDPHWPERTAQLLERITQLCPRTGLK